MLRPAILVVGFQSFELAPCRWEVIVEVIAALFAFALEEVDEAVQVSLKIAMFSVLDREEDITSISYHE